MDPIEIFVRDCAAHHILENLSQRFLSNVLNFYSSMVTGGVSKILFF